MSAFGERVENNKTMYQDSGPDKSIYIDDDMDVNASVHFRLVCHIPFGR